jgi:Fe-S-cluster containining protein
MDRKQRNQRRKNRKRKVTELQKQKLGDMLGVLNLYYSDLPETKGCMENLEQCKGWCCRDQCPSLFLIEFLNIWGYIVKVWSIEEILDLIEKCVRTYVYNKPTKGCVFFNEKTYLCNIHKKRPMNCYFYGITPEEEFNKRYEKLKERFKNDPEAIIKKQCDLVTAYNKEGEEIEFSQETMDIFFQKLMEVEGEIGVKEEDMNDDIGGTYRTPHDHVLLRIIPDDIMLEFQKVRLMKNKEEKEIVINKFMELFKNNIKVKGK